MKTFSTARGTVEVTFHFPDLIMRHWPMMEMTMPRQVIEGIISTIETDLTVDISKGTLDVTILGCSWEQTGGALFGVVPGTVDGDEYIKMLRDYLGQPAFGVIASPLSISEELYQALQRAGYAEGSLIDVGELPDEILQIIAKEMVEADGSEARCACGESDCRLGKAIEAEKKSRN